VYFPPQYRLKKTKGARLFGFFLPTRMEFDTPEGRLKWSSRAHRSSPRHTTHRHTTRHARHSRMSAH
jgi:hypothetical protein